MVHAFVVVTPIHVKGAVWSILTAVIEIIATRRSVAARLAVGKTVGAAPKDEFVIRRLGCVFAQVVVRIRIANQTSSVRSMSVWRGCRYTYDEEGNVTDPRGNCADPTLICDSRHQCSVPDTSCLNDQACELSLNQLGAYCDRGACQFAVFCKRRL